MAPEAAVGLRQKQRRQAMLPQPRIKPLRVWTPCIRLSAASCSRINHPLVAFVEEELGEVVAGAAAVDDEKVGLAA